METDSILCPTPSLDVIDINVLVLGDTVPSVSQANCVWIAFHNAEMGGVLLEAWFAPLYPVPEFR